MWRKRNIKQIDYKCFETFSNYIFENEINMNDNIIATVSKYLDTLKNSFDSYYFFVKLININK